MSATMPLHSIDANTRQTKVIKTRLTEKFDLKYPIMQAPMALAAGGELASAVSRAGGLGFIGGGYGDKTWLKEQFELAGNQPVGCGFITWSLLKQPELLDYVLTQQTTAIFLSFGDPSSITNVIANARVPLICQVQNLRHARQALDAGAQVIVAQGAEAGGHGDKRSTMTLVPEVADLLAKQFPDVLLCAAGGIADGRGLAASLSLGADGVLIGSRFWASHEALVHPNMHSAAINASGDDTLRSSVMDMARLLDWPKPYTARVLKNEFTQRWHNHEDELLKQQSEQAQLWKNAWAEGDTSIANTFVGEATGMINDICSATDILADITGQAEAILARSYQP